MFASEMQSDTDFSKPLSNVFIRKIPGGCIEQLQSKQKSHGNWTQWANDMPFTIGALVGASSTRSAVPSKNTSVSQLKAAVLAVPKIQKRPVDGETLLPQLCWEHCALLLVYALSASVLGAH